jgi:integration host factor subunit alpha
MPSKNVTRADLAQAVAQAVGLPKHEAITLSEQVLTEICDTLEHRTVTRTHIRLP